MKALLRSLLRGILQYYPREYGKYSILQKLYFPYLNSPTIGTTVVGMRDGFRLNLLPNELLQAHLYLFGTYELPTTNFIRRFLQKGDIVIDIGANIGYMSLFFGKCIGETGKVYAFEPESKNFEALKFNVNLNNVNNISLHQIAVTDTEKPLRLYLATDNLGAHSTIYNEENLTVNFVEIQGIPLDSFVLKQNINRIALIKIDVEGAEYEVLQGMNNILEHQRPVIIMEWNESIQVQRGFSFKMLEEEYIKKYHYEIFSTNERGKLIPFQQWKFENSIFIPHERLPSLTALFA